MIALGYRYDNSLAIAIGIPQRRTEEAAYRHSHRRVMAYDASQFRYELNWHRRELRVKTFIERWKPRSVSSSR